MNVHGLQTVKLSSLMLLIFWPSSFFLFLKHSGQAEQTFLVRSLTFSLDLASVSAIELWTLPNSPSCTLTMNRQATHVFAISIGRLDTPSSLDRLFSPILPLLTIMPSSLSGHKLASLPSFSAKAVSGIAERSNNLSSVSNLPATGSPTFSAVRTPEN